VTDAASNRAESVDDGCRSKIESRQRKASENGRRRTRSTAVVATIPDDRVATDDTTRANRFATSAVGSQAFTSQDRHEIRY
jgi:hypothetical protein